MSLTWEFKVILPRVWKAHPCGEVWFYRAGRRFLGAVVKRLDGRFDTIPMRKGKPFTSKGEAKAFVEKARKRQ